MQITFNIKDEIIPELVEAYCATFGYTEGAESPEDFTVRQAEDVVLKVLTDHRQKKAIAAVQVETLAEDVIIKEI